MLRVDRRVLAQGVSRPSIAVDGQELPVSNTHVFAQRGTRTDVHTAQPTRHIDQDVDCDAGVCVLVDILYLPGTLGRNLQLRFDAIDHDVGARKGTKLGSVTTDECLSHRQVPAGLVNRPGVSGDFLA
jgi:hypothetical protein